MAANPTSRPAASAVLTAFALALDRCGAEVMRAFADHGVPVILLKGPVLAGWLYGDGTLRPYQDVDLLVPPWAFERAEEVLVHIGFRPRHRRVGEPGQAIYAANWIRAAGENVDLHRAVPEATRPVLQVWEELERHRVPFRLADADVMTLDVARQAMWVAMHAGHHGIGEPKPLEDLRRALQAVSVEAWAEAASTATAIGAEGTFAAGLRLDPEGTKIADQLHLARRFSRSVELRIGRRDESFTLTIERLLQEPGFSRKAMYVLLHLVPPPERIREAYPLAQRGSGALVLMYLWRPLRRLPSSARALGRWVGVHNRTRPRRLSTRPGGPARLPRATYIGNFLHEHGLNPTYAESLVPMLRAAGVDVRESSHAINRPSRLFDQLLAVGRTRRRDSTVIIDLYGGPRAFPAGVVAAAACRVLRRRYVVALHGGSLPQRLDGGRWAIRFAVGGAHRVVAPSSYLADSFRELATVEVIPNGVPTSAFPTGDRASVRPRLLFLRAYSKEYGALTMIQAFAALRREFPDATLTMAGPDLDGSRAECERWARSLSVADAVTFLGQVPKADIAKLALDHDIFVNPTTVDNTPITVVEAMAMGLCVVASEVGGLPALLDFGRLGLLVRPTPEAVALGVATCLRDPDAALARASAAAVAVQSMDWSEVVPRWVSLIASPGGSR